MARTLAGVDGMVWTVVATCRSLLFSKVSAVVSLLDRARSSTTTGLEKRDCLARVGLSATLTRRKKIILFVRRCQNDRTILKGDRHDGVLT